LLDAVADMPETTVLFLRKLHKIHIVSTASNAQVTETIFERQDHGLPRTLAVLKRSQLSAHESVIDESSYVCYSCAINNMPKDERRNGRKSALVELAFPIDQVTKQPKLNELGQHVFAFLPLQRLPQIQVRLYKQFAVSTY
jgi:cbb3-type cytochrome oxidase cytochrome c subunit